MTLSITILCHCAECHYAECRVLFIIRLIAIMLSVIMLGINMLNVVAPWKDLVYKKCQEIYSTKLGDCIQESIS
jgi:hypothetical protein